MGSTDLRIAAQQALEFIRWSQYVPCQSEAFPEPPSTAPQVEAALKAALAEPVQEPVAWRYKKEGGGWFVSDNEPQYVEQWNDIEEIQPLYTAPPQRKPLTEEEIDNIWDSEKAFADIYAIARAIERAHGIGGNDE